MHVTTFLLAALACPNLCGLTWKEYVIDKDSFFPPSTLTLQPHLTTLVYNSYWLLSFLTVILVTHKLGSDTYGFWWQILHILTVRVSHCGGRVTAVLNHVLTRYCIPDSFLGSMLTLMGTHLSWFSTHLVVMHLSTKDHRQMSCQDSNEHMW